MFKNDIKVREKILNLPRAGEFVMYANDLYLIAEIARITPSSKEDEHVTIIALKKTTI